MPVNYVVQADVVNVEIDNPRNTDSFLVDSNVWYWMTYTKASMSSQPPRAYQIRFYPSYVEKARRIGSRLHRCDLALAELAHLIEEKEFELFKKIASGSGVNLKEFRHNHIVERRGVVGEILIAWRQVKSITADLNLLVNGATGDAAITNLNSYSFNAYDLFILEAMKQSGILAIISDDGDFSTIPGIMLYTANRAVLSAAQSQGKLVSR